MPTHLFEDELDVFFDTDDFGTTATPPKGKPFNGLLNSPYARRDLGQNQVNSQHYSFICKACEAQAIRQGSTLQIDHKNYQVISLEPDGLGVVTLIIEPLQTVKAIADDDFNY